MSGVVFKEAKFLIVDDQVENVELLKRILKRAGYEQIMSTTDSTRFLGLFLEYRPDIVLLDLHMPKISGVELLLALKNMVSPEEYIPVLVLTADTTAEAKKKVLSAGAKDFVTKPIDRPEVLLRINNLLETRRLHLQLSAYNQRLERTVTERTSKLEQAQHEILEAMAKATEYRDDDTGEHAKRVGELSSKLALAMGMDPAEAEILQLAAPLHDAGKIGIPDSILLKPGKLTAEEFELIKSHTWIGKEILSESQFPVLRMAADIAVSHHENWDGSGYPYGLKGDEIPLVGQIVSIVDMFDALTHERPYKHAWNVAEAVREIERQSGNKFNPVLVQEFFGLIRPDKQRLFLSTEGR